MANVLIGCDPEVFVQNKEGKIIPGCGLLGGTKKNPRKTKHGYVQEDNVTAEFNIPPTDCKEEFFTSIENTINDLREILYPNYISIIPSHTFGKEINKLPPAWVQGCDPDECLELTEALHTLEYFPQYGNPVYLRTAGGHIHISLRENNYHKQIAAVRAAQHLIGEWYCRTNMPLYKARLTYFSRSSYRLKPYGIEYRFPSNFWIARKDTIEDIFTLSQTIANVVDEGMFYAEKNSAEYNALTKTIVNSLKLNCCGGG